MSITTAPPFVGHPVTAAVAVVQAAVVQTTEPGGEVWRLPDAELLAATSEYLRARAVLQGLGCRLIAELDRRRVTVDEFGVDTSIWLTTTRQLSLRSARAEVAVATVLADRFTATSDALAAGAVSGEQASAIIRTLAGLPGSLEPSEVRAAEATLLGFAGEFDPAGLTRLARATLEVVAPEVAERAEADRLAREEREATRTRYLRWSADGMGSTLVWGKLPVVDAQMLGEVVDALAAHAPVIDAEGDRVPLESRRADALMAITEQYLSDGVAPDHGGDRPRVTVLLGYESLVDGLTGAALLGADEPVSAAAARQLACDADVLPVVLGGRGQVLDVGRTRRLFGNDLRQALTARDRGCVFPGCDRPPRQCEAHHLIPWWAGGSTSLDNGALVCRFHHRLVEPDPQRPEHHQWHLRMSSDGIPEVLPPAHNDPERRPRRHHRFTTRR